MAEDQMKYRSIESAPENIQVMAVWGIGMPRAEYGLALRLGDQWYKESDPNPYARGRPCAMPDGWLPENRKDWTDEEKKLCDSLAFARRE